MRVHVNRPFVAAAALVVASSTSFASAVRAQSASQASSCTYDRCALHVESVPGVPDVTRLVQGIEARPVETRGVFVPRIPLLESSGDSVRIPYEAYRSRRRESAGLLALTVGASVASVFILRSRAPVRPSNAVPALGADLALGIAGLVEAKRAQDALDLAVARYNAGLPNR
jgi:hypothetical protein